MVIVRVYLYVSKNYQYRRKTHDEEKYYADCDESSRQASVLYERCLFSLQEP